MTKADPIGGALLSQIFPEHRETHIIGFCVTVEPGRVIAQRDHATADENEDSGYVSILIRGSPRLEAGEVVHAGLYEPAGKGALRCIKRILYPHLVLPDGWRETIPTEEALWADEDFEHTEFFGIPVGELIYGPSLFSGRSSISPIARDALSIFASHAFASASMPGW